MLSLVSIVLLANNLQRIWAGNYKYYDETTTPEPNFGGGGTPSDGICEYNINYYFEGIPCQISGDPHFITFNGASHDFMGQPNYENNGLPLSQFYYVTQCYGVSTSNMPFRIAGNHYNLYPIVTGLDYLIIELYDDNTVFDLFLSPDFIEYGDINDKGSSTFYDEIPSGALTSIRRNGKPVYIGSRFTVTVDENYGAVNLKLEIEQDGDTFTNEISISCQSRDDNGRCRQTYANIRIDPYYKCRSCGLCGDFVSDDKNRIQACDGTYLEFRSGSNAEQTPEAFDPFGWTYEREYYLNTCDAYDITDLAGFQYLSPCDESDQFTAAVKQECANRAHVWADCCREISEECVNMQRDCNLDTCVRATEDGVGNYHLIADAAIEAFDNAMRTICSLPLDIYDPYYVGSGNDNCGNGEWQQCDGKGFKGEKCCASGFKCVYDNEWYSQCREDPSQTPGCASSWQQCGGKNHKGPTCCNQGYICIYDNDYYSQCVPVNNALTEPLNALNQQLSTTSNTFTFNDYMSYIMFIGIITLIFNLIAYGLTYSCCLKNGSNINNNKWI